MSAKIKIVHIINSFEHYSISYLDDFIFASRS